MNNQINLCIKIYFNLYGINNDQVKEDNVEYILSIFLWKTERKERKIFMRKAQEKNLSFPHSFLIDIELSSTDAE